VQQQGESEIVPGAVSGVASGVVQIEDVVVRGRCPPALRQSQLLVRGCQGVQDPSLCPLGRRVPCCCYCLRRLGSRMHRCGSRGLDRRWVHLILGHIRPRRRIHRLVQKEVRPLGPVCDLGRLRHLGPSRL
jgi:hypothetical protein